MGKSYSKGARGAWGPINLALQCCGGAVVWVVL